MPRFNASYFRFWLFIALLVTAPFSKYPSIATPLYNFTSFRIGLYPVLALLFITACLRPTLSAVPKLYKQSKAAVISTVVLVLIGVLGFVSSIYKARTVLLLGSIVLLLTLLVVAWWYTAFELPAKKYKQVLKIMLIAGCVWGGVAIIQFVLASFLNTTLGLQCRGCGSQVFGFPRVSGFAAEPQFFANALLLYFFIGLGAFYTFRSRLALSATILTLMGIGLTFSRGAFMALGVGSLVFFILLRVQKQVRIRTIAKHFSVLVAMIIIVAASFVAAASYKYRATPDIAYKTLRSMVQQGTLGIVKLPASMTEAGSFTPAGLVQASGNDRLEAARLSLRAWRYSPYTSVFGVGAGNLGPFVVRHLNPSAPNNLTVYIFYVLLLSEFGVLGLVAFLLLHGFALAQFIQKYWRHKNAGIYTSLFCLGLAFLIQYCFFGSYINVPYIWLCFGILLGLGRKGTKAL